MSTTTPTTPADEALVPPLPQVELLETDGEPLETDWHRIEINLLVELVYQHFAGRDDFYAGGNMFLYYSEEQARNRDYRGPDFFFVRGATPTPLRPYWVVWKEGGRYPNVIVELLSPTTAKLDRTVKKDLYEQVFRTPDYFCYDPETKNLEGWQRTPEYTPLTPNERGWLWSGQLGLWLGTWDGVHQGKEATWLRFYTPEGTLVPTAAEAGRHEAEVAKREAETARREAEAAQQQAEAERQRADALEAEVARLKAQLEARRHP